MYTHEQIEIKIAAINKYMDQRNNYRRLLLETRNKYSIYVLFEGTKQQVENSCASRQVIKTNREGISTFLDGFCLSIGMLGCYVTQEVKTISESNPIEIPAIIN